ncbi:MAG: hypothetical protein HXY34_02035 [Candidatus Thorarchaeota archaeon]|nr:hypothetical protein [Candidatus Thorarchaeota archaeon]
MRSKKPYRSKIRIMVDMMRAIQATGDDGAGPTKILYGANLSHDRLTQYLEELLQKELIVEVRESDESRLYALTEKGRSFLDEFVKVERLSDAFGIEI